MTFPHGGGLSRVRGWNVTAHEQQVGTAIWSHLYLGWPAGLPHANCHLYSGLHSLLLLAVSVKPWHWLPSARHLVIQKNWLRPTVTPSLLTSMALCSVSQSLLLLHALIGTCKPGNWRCIKSIKNKSVNNNYPRDYEIITKQLKAKYCSYFKGFVIKIIECVKIWVSWRPWPYKKKENPL